MYMSALEEESEKSDKLQLNTSTFIAEKEAHLLAIKKEVYNENFTPGGPILAFEEFNETLDMIPDYYLSTLAQDLIIKLGFLGNPKKTQGLSKAHIEESLSTWLPRESWNDFFFKCHCLAYASHIDRGQANDLRKVTKRFGKFDRENMTTILNYVLSDKCE